MIAEAVRENKRAALTQAQEEILARMAKMSKNPQESVTWNMRGKMEGMISISTACTIEGSNCQRRIALALRQVRAFSPAAAEILDRGMLPSRDKRHLSSTEIAEMLVDIGCPVCVCIFCYAEAALTTSFTARNMRNKFETNYHYYQTIRPQHELPKFPDGKHRIEAFGDTQSVCQAINYCNICLANPGSTFTAWTKNPGYWERAFLLQGKPVNLRLGLSSPYINTPAIDLYNYYNRKYSGQFIFFDFLFTVYTEKFAITHGIAFNCCNGREERHCLECQACYEEGHSPYRNEILRSK